MYQNAGSMPSGHEICKEVEPLKFENEKNEYYHKKVTKQEFS